MHFTRKLTALLLTIPLCLNGFTALAQSAAAIPESANKTLIVYFSAASNSDVDAVSSASIVTMADGTVKGAVQSVADMIQPVTGADLYAIETIQDYPGGIGTLIEFAAQEQDVNGRPELANHIENLDQYDTVFIGYPIWWYDLPMSMYTFFEEYDFTGKTIIPFTTHRGSRFSSTIQTIAELEPGATVLTDGFTVAHEQAQDAEADVNTWLQGLGY